MTDITVLARLLNGAMRNVDLTTNTPVVFSIKVGGVTNTELTKAILDSLIAHAASTSNPHAVTKAQVGLSDVDNTSDINKPVSTAQALADTAVQNFSIARANHTGSQLASTISDFTAAAKAAAVADAIADGVTDVAPSQNAVFDALALKINSSLIGANNGVASLDGSGKLLAGQIPALAITDTFVVANQAAMLALTAQTGDIAIRSDESKTYILQGSDPTVLGNWVFLATPASAVLSVNSQTGVVVLTTADIADSSNKRYVTDADLVDIGNLSGTNSGDQTITLTGDVTGSGTGSFATTIAADSVTTAKILDANVTLAKLASASVDENKLTASVAGNGLTGGAGSALAVGAHADGSIVVSANDIQVASAPALKGSEVAGESFAATAFAVRMAKAADAGFVAGRVYKAAIDASSADNFYVVGLVNAAASAGGAIVVTKMGPMTITGHGFTVGSPVFLDAGGALTGTAPSASNMAVVRVGMVRDANTIEVGIQVMGIL